MELTPLFYIGKQPVYVPIIVSPMSGISDLAFRIICYRHGNVDLALNEMILANKQLTASGVNEELIENCLPFIDNPRAINWFQIIGNDARNMADLTEFILNQQAADVLDINFGCPAKKVVKKAAGSALMADVQTLTEIIKAVISKIRENSDIPLTIKMRTGVDDEHKNAVEIAKLAEELGVSAITIHGRTRAQLYHGQAEYQTIKMVKEAVNIPVIANGDINSIEKYQYVLDHTGADAVMIGRWSFGNPWLLAELVAFATNQEYQQPTLIEKFKVVIEHVQLLNEHYAPRYALNNARKHVSWYLENLFPSIYPAKGYNNHNSKPAKLLTPQNQEVKQISETKLSEQTQDTQQNIQNSLKPQNQLSPQLKTKLQSVLQKAKQQTSKSTAEIRLADELAPSLESREKANYRELSSSGLSANELSVDELTADELAISYFNSHPEYVERKKALIKPAVDTEIIKQWLNDSEFVARVGSWKSTFNRLQTNAEQLEFLTNCLGELTKKER